MSSRGSRRAVVVVLLAVLGGCGREPDPRPASTAQTPHPAAVTPAPAAPAVDVDMSRNDVDTPPPLTDADILPLPVTPFPAARPMEIVRAVYVFAAKHPEILSKVPCFCGCETRGHRHNDDCFVAARDAHGRPTAWEPHGAG
jgi:hypothetical protein